MIIVYYSLNFFKQEVNQLIRAGNCAQLIVREERAFCPACGSQTQIVSHSDTVPIIFPLSVNNM